MWRYGRRYISSYLDFDTIKDQYRLLNLTLFDCIIGYTTEDDVGDRDFKRIPQIRLKTIGVSISSYCYINCTERLDMIKKEKNMEYVLGDI